MENQQTADPLDNEQASPGQRSRSRAATGIQSSVEPDDYPEAERDLQVTAATGQSRKGTGNR